MAETRLAEFQITEIHSTGNNLTQCQMAENCLAKNRFVNLKGAHFNRFGTRQEIH